MLQTDRLTRGSQEPVWLTGQDRPDLGDGLALELGVRCMARVSSYQYNVTRNSLTSKRAKSLRR